MNTMKDYTCGLCGEEFSSNCSPGDIQCTECDARLCPCCGVWFSELGEMSKRLVLPVAAQEAQSAADWTVDPETGRTNASPAFRSLVEDVERLLRGGAGGAVLHESWTSGTAALIVAQLAHVHHLAPTVPSEVRTCYCGTTATVIPEIFPHRDCDGSVPKKTVRQRFTEILASMTVEVRPLLADVTGATPATGQLTDPAWVAGVLAGALGGDPVTAPVSGD